MSQTAAELRIRGMVQGVGFRWFARERARANGVSGWVRNNPDGTVSAYAEGDETAVRLFVEELREGPRGGAVSDVDLQWSDFTGKYSTFDIKH